MVRLIQSIEVDAPKQLVWEVISDVSNYAKYAPQIHHVEIVSGNGLGMVRACSNEKGRWTETCTNWQPGHAYTFEVNVQEKGFPLPLKKITGNFQISENKKGLPTITFELLFQPKFKWVVFILFPLIRKKQEASMADVLNSWAKEITNRSSKIKANV